MRPFCASRGVGRVGRIDARSVYRALGAEHIRHRRTASPVLLRRLLSLEHVIEHLDRPWLPTEAEKVAAFGIGPLTVGHGDSNGRAPRIGGWTCPPRRESHDETNCG